MTLNDMRLYINALLNKDQFGGELNLKEFNIALQEYNIEFFKNKTEGLYVADVGGALDYDLVLATKVLKPFVKLEPAILAPDGELDLSAALPDYAFFLKAISTSAHDGERKTIKLSTHSKVFERMTNVLSVSLYDRPECVLEGTGILRIYPDDIPEVDIAYLRFPVAPYFDYYIDANDKEQPIPAGQSHTLIAGESGPNGEVAPAVLVGATVELEYTEDFHPEFLNGLLGKLGLPNRDQVIIQTSMANEQKFESK